MIVCSCAVISDRDIEAALVAVLSQPKAPIPTPGVIFRHLAKKMNCCGCASLAVETIYKLVEKLERDGRLCPTVGQEAMLKLRNIDRRRHRMARGRALPIATGPRGTGRVARSGTQG